MRSLSIALVASLPVAFVCIRVLGADPVLAKKNSMQDFFSELERIQRKAYDKVDADSKDPEFARKELLRIYADLVFRSEVEVEKGLFATKNGIPLEQVPFLDAAEKRHVEEMKIRVLGILAATPQSKLQGEPRK